MHDYFSEQARLAEIVNAQTRAQSLLGIDTSSIRQMLQEIEASNALTIRNQIREMFASERIGLPIMASLSETIERANLSVAASLEGYASTASSILEKMRLQEDAVERMRLLTQPPEMPHLLAGLESYSLRESLLATKLASDTAMLSRSLYDDSLASRFSRIVDDCLGRFSLDIPAWTDIYRSSFSNLGLPVSPLLYEEEAEQIIDAAETAIVEAGDSSTIKPSEVVEAKRRVVSVVERREIITHQEAMALAYRLGSYALKNPGKSLTLAAVVVLCLRSCSGSPLVEINIDNTIEATGIQIEKPEQ